MMTDAKHPSSREPLAGTVLEEADEMTFEQLCEACAIDEQWIAELVHEGVLEPRGQGVARWRFSALSVRRVQITWRLQRDLDVNLPGAGLILDLMDEIEVLRRQLNRHGVTAPPDADGGRE